MNTARISRLARWLLPAVAAGLLGAPARGADDTYVNNGVVTVPPVVNATNFINNNLFNVFLGLGTPYETTSTRNYTNRGTMAADLGFRFRNNPESPAPWFPSDNWENTGLISAGAGGFFFGSLPRIIVNATNIICRGTNVVGVDGLFQASGQRLDFSRATVQMESSSTGGTGVGGVNTGYWGLGTNRIVPATLEALPPITPLHQINYPCGLFTTFNQLVLSDARAYTRDAIAGSNRTVQVAFVGGSNPAISNNVYFLGESIAVEWIWQSQDPFSAAVVTNYMYLFDDLLSRSGTNIALFTSLVDGCVVSQPNNYFFQYGGPLFVGGAWPISPPAGVLPLNVVSNDFTAYNAHFTAATAVPSGLPGAPSIVNLPGRIEFNAGQSLDLGLARIAGLNYLKLAATNHFVGSAGAKLLAAYSDVDLASTNGSLTLTNLLLPDLPRLVGDVQLYSAKWETVDQNITNGYHLLYVQSLLETGSPTLVQDLKLRATNHITISDEFNILRTMVVDTENLTLTTNAPGADSPTGVLNLLTNAEVGPANFPHLRNLTNCGVIGTANLLTLGTAAQPIQTIINCGSILSEAATINVGLLVNPGLIGAGVNTLGSGSLTLNANTAYLTNGQFLAPKGDVTLNANTLVVSNTALQALRQITLSITNLLDDGGVKGSNVWAAGNDGFRLLQRPAAGDLLGTTIANIAGPLVVVPNRWDGEDRGRDVAGFLNNGALGKLTLRGTNGTVFDFSAVHGTNALYVDLVELQGSTTNIDGLGNLTGVSFGPNMKLYYGDMLADGQSVAERLHGKNNGGLQWVPAYAGLNSGTNLLYPDGTTNRLNRALVTSCNLDSDGDAIPNCADPTPVFVATQLNFRAALTNVPPNATRLTWRAIQDSTSTVYYKSAVDATNWTVLTNVTVPANAVPPFGARTVSATDPVSASSNRFYRVELAVPQP
jgi:hypothetical protein